MRYTSRLLVLTNVLGIVQGTALPQITQAPYLHEKRDDAHVTLNIGPISIYQQTTPSGTSMVIYPTDATAIPAHGIYILLGSELQTSLKNAVKDNCANVNDQKCIDSISNVFNSDGDSIEGRAEFNWLSAGRGAGHIAFVFSKIVAYLTAKWEDNAGGPQAPPLNFHFPASALSQVSSASAASLAVFQTATDDPSAVSVTMDATATGGSGSASPTSGGPLSKVTADGNGRAAGDIEIDLDDAGSTALNNFFHEGKCQAAPSKRGLERRDPTVVDCLVNNAQDILNAMGANGALNALSQPAMQVATTFPFPEFANPDYAAGFGEFAVWAGDAISNVLNGIAQPQIVPATIFVYLLAVADYAQTFMQARKLFLQAKSLLTDKDFSLVCPSRDNKFYPSCSKFICQGKSGKCTTDLMKPCPCSGDAANCPTDFSKTPFCSACGGKAGMCTSGDSNGCDCIEVVEANGVGPDPADWLDTQQSLLSTIGEYKPGSGGASPASCNTDQGNISEIPFNVFSPGIYSNFCKSVDPKNKLSQIVDSSGNVIPPKAKERALVQERTPPPNPSLYAGYTIALTWTGGDGSCHADCESAYWNIVNSRCGHQGGQLNVMANAGELDTGCGKYSYSITAPPTPAPTPPSPPPKPTRGPIICKANLDSYSDCWNDIHADSVDSCASAMFVQIPNDPMTSSSPNVTQVLREGASGGQGGNGVTYMMNIGWIPGCSTYPSQAADNPMGKSEDSSVSYTTLIKETYHNCTGNSGLGGYQDVGCLRYGFFPSLIDGIFASPPHPEKYWQAGMKFCG